ncbi:MAG: hypothetical protein Ct9H300mP28_06700 [Pseudomonadota bacterium]|nr:MAG: hypothetical protein Ct9H300mP28_06700 [Pseudomonadota bacterium]
MFDPFALPNTYAIPNLHVDYVPSKIPINFGFWRSTGAYHNSFALESALDEVALQEAGFHMSSAGDY